MNGMKCMSITGDDTMGMGNRTIIKTHVARKPYLCALCDGQITPGEHYQKASYQVEGHFYSRNYCIMEGWKDIHADVRAEKEKLEG